MATDYDELRSDVAESQSTSLQALQSANAPDARSVVRELDEADAFEGNEVPGGEFVAEELIIAVVPQKEDEFTGKPLKDLFKEIKPSIRLVLPEGGGDCRPTFFIFYFTTKQVYDGYRRQGKFPLSLKVYLKGKFEWSYEGRNRTRDHYMDWTSADEEKYGNLIIAAIRISGEYNPCDYNDWYL